MNDKIVENNKLVGKKNQKKLLEMPDMPNKPRYKYFCNLLILKGMIRNWFEL